MRLPNDNHDFDCQCAHCYAPSTGSDAPHSENEIPDNPTKAYLKGLDDARAQVAWSLQHNGAESVRTLLSDYLDGGKVTSGKGIIALGKAMRKTATSKSSDAPHTRGVESMPSRCKCGHYESYLCHAKNPDLAMASNCCCGGFESAGVEPVPTISSNAGVPIRPQEDCMSEPTEVEFTELVGKHFLSGVDRENVEVKTWGEHFEPCEVLRFVLDGKTYTATEDPSDGYRSSLRSFVESDSPVINQFAPVEVMAVYQDKGDYGTSSDILNLIDAVTGEVVLSVGTDNNDDYYPSFIGYFAPENMACNSSDALATTSQISEPDSEDKK